MDEKRRRIALLIGKYESEGMSSVAAGWRALQELGMMKGHSAICPPSKGSTTKPAPAKPPRPAASAPAPKAPPAPPKPPPEQPAARFERLVAEGVQAGLRRGAAVREAVAADPAAHRAWIEAVNAGLPAKLPTPMDALHVRLAGLAPERAGTVAGEAFACSPALQQEFRERGRCEAYARAYARNPSLSS